MFNFTTMKKITISVLMLISLVASGQSIDTVLNAGNYKSYINYQLMEPVYVSYVLYQGGGDCSRSGFSFKNDTEIQLHGNESYYKSGFDKGHLANAEDFAYDCDLDKKTFMYYNCLPQTPNLNRGIWKTWENTVRKESQQDSLLVICGGKWETAKNINYVNGMNVPILCWKVVYSLKTQTVLHALLFTNLSSGSSAVDMKLEELETLLGYELDLTF